MDLRRFSILASVLNAAICFGVGFFLLNTSFQAIFERHGWVQAIVFQFFPPSGFASLMLIPAAFLVRDGMAGEIIVTALSFILLVVTAVFWVVLFTADMS